MGDKCCTIAPNFKLSDGKLGAFIAKTREKTKGPYYGFSSTGSEVCCGEGYKHAEGLRAHLQNIGSVLEESLKIA